MLYDMHCVYDGKFLVKDLSRLGRPLDKVIIIDNN